MRTPLPTFTIPNSSGSPLTETWSDEARAASIAARRMFKQGAPKPKKEPKGRAAKEPEEEKLRKRDEKRQAYEAKRRDKERAALARKKAAAAQRELRKAPERVHLTKAKLRRDKIGPRSGSLPHTTRESNALREVSREDLRREFGIEQFEYPHPDSTIKHIGFSPRDQKWYGWSHRAIFGFGIGDEVKKGDVIAPDREYPPLRGESLPIGFKAKTLADARRMAAAFALAVS